MSYPVIERFLRRYGLPSKERGPFLARPSQELLALSRDLRQMPLKLSLVRLSDAQRRDLQTPLPPHLHQIGLFLATLLKRRPDLGRRLGVPKGLVEAVLQREVDLGKLIQLAETLARTAETGKLLLGAALREVNEALAETAGRVGEDQTLSSARRAYLAANLGAFVRMRNRKEVSRARQRGRQAARRARAEAEVARARARAEETQAIEELKRE